MRTFELRVRVGAKWFTRKKCRATFAVQAVNIFRREIEECANRGERTAIRKAKTNPKAGR